MPLNSRALVEEKVVSFTETMTLRQRDALAMMMFITYLSIA